MTLSKPSPEVEALFISDAQLLEDGGVKVDDPRLDPLGQRGTAILAGACAGIAGGLVAAWLLIAGVRWPAGLALSALAVMAIAMFIELEEVAMVAIFMALGALVWLGFRVAAAPLELPIVALLAAMLVGAGVYAAVRHFRLRGREREGHDVLARLHASVARYNALVKALDVKDKLARARGGPPAPMQESVLAAIRATRENLLRAVRVHRVLRENRDVVRNAEAVRFEALVPLEALQLDDSAEAHAELAAETLQVAAEVEQAYEELRESSASRKVSP